MTTWHAHKIVSPDDQEHLDAVAEEHGHHIAYQRYKRRQHKEAADHHHQQAVNLKSINQKDSDRHRAMYEAHMGAIGLPANYDRTHFPKSRSEVYTGHKADVLL